MILAKKQIHSDLAIQDELLFIARFLAFLPFTRLTVSRQRPAVFCLATVAHLFGVFTWIITRFFIEWFSANRNCFINVVAVSMARWFLPLIRSDKRIEHWLLISKQHTHFVCFFSGFVPLTISSWLFFYFCLPPLARTHIQNVNKSTTNTAECQQANHPASQSVRSSQSISPQQKRKWSVLMNFT